MRVPWFWCACVRLETEKVTGCVAIFFHWNFDVFPLILALVWEKCASSEEKKKNFREVLEFVSKSRTALTTKSKIPPHEDPKTLQTGWTCETSPPSSTRPP